MAQLFPYSALMPLAPWESPAIVSQALQSLLNQTFTPQQVVVSCDGRLPEALAQCLKNTELSIELVMGPGSEGVGPVLARGLVQCSQELVLRIDADDLSLPVRAEEQITWMNQHPYVIVMSSTISEFCECPEEPLFQRLVPIGSKSIRRVSRWRNPLNHPSVILRRSAVLALGNYGSFPGFEDYELWLRVLQKHGPHAIANISKPLVLVRVGPSHLGRRHGISYALAETRFLLHSARNRLLPFWCVLISLMLRPFETSAS